MLVGNGSVFVRSGDALGAASSTSFASSSCFAAATSKHARHERVARLHAVLERGVAVRLGQHADPAAEREVLHAVPRPGRVRLPLRAVAEKLP